MTQVNERVEQVVAELAALIEEGHLLSCDGGGACSGPDCADKKARGVLAYLHGAGVLVWGQGHQPLPRPPEGAKDAYAVRVLAEFWHPIERTAEDIENEVTRYHWVPGVVATAAGYDHELVGDQVCLFTQDLTHEQAEKLCQIAWALYGDLDSRS